MLSKGVKIALIIFLIIIIIGLISAMVFVMVNKDKNYSVSFLAFGNKTKMLLQEEFNIDDVKEIVATATSSNIKFVEGSLDKVKVTIYGKKGENATASINDGKLEINKDNNKIYILAFFIYMKDEIVVELPKNYNGEIRNICNKWKYTSIRPRRSKY